MILCQARTESDKNILQLQRRTSNQRQSQLESEYQVAIAQSAIILYNYLSPLSVQDYEQVKLGVNKLNFCREPGITCICKGGNRDTL